MSLHLGLDLGGTNIKWAVIDEQHAEVAQGSTDTHAEGGPEVVIERLIETGREAIARVGSIATVGLGVPGRYDGVRGEVLMLTNLPGEWHGVPAGARLSEELSAPTRIINDARAFCLAEATLGAGRGVATMVGVTLGTGIGGGTVLDGRVHFGNDGSAGEIGHQIVAAGPGALLCNCGNYGCLETLTKADVLEQASGRATVDDAFEAAASGDVRAQKAIDEWIAWLAIGLANVVATLTPDRIVIGGGVARAGDALFLPLSAELRKRIKYTDPDHVEVVPAELGSTAGAVGAALHGLLG